MSRDAERDLSLELLLSNECTRPSTRDEGEGEREASSVSLTGGVGGAPRVDGGDCEWEDAAEDGGVGRGREKSVK